MEADKTTSLGRKLVSDITYVRLKDRWTYLTVILDPADWVVVGWSISRDMGAAHNVMAAWADARRTRSIQPEFVVAFRSGRSIWLQAIYRYAIA